MKHVLSVLALAAVAGLASPAFAQTYRAVASGPAESPPNGSPGSSMVTIDIGSSNLMVDMSFRDLVGTSMASHIHCCTADAFTGTAPIAMPFSDFPTGVRTGDYTMAIPLYEDTSYDPAFLKAHGGTVSGAASAPRSGCTRRFRSAAGPSRPASVPTITSTPPPATAPWPTTATTTAGAS